MVALLAKGRILTGEQEQAQRSWTGRPMEAEASLRWNRQASNDPSGATTRDLSVRQRGNCGSAGDTLASPYTRPMSNAQRKSASGMRSASQD